MDKEDFKKIIDESWSHGCLSGMEIIKKSLVDACARTHNGSLTAREIDYIVSGVIESAKK